MNKIKKKKKKKKKKPRLQIWQEFHFKLIHVCCFRKQSRNVLLTSEINTLNLK